MSSRISAERKRVLGRCVSQGFARCCLAILSWSYPQGQPGSRYFGVTKWWHLAFVTTCLTCIFLLLTMASNNGRYPWELTSLQRGLVDNCFEEGQYETAIATLDQLRSPDFNPHPWVRLISFYSSTQFFQPSSTTIDIYFPSIYARADSWIRYWHLCSNVSV